MSGYLYHSNIDIWGHNPLRSRAFLYFAGCWAASRASTHQMPIAFSAPKCDHQKCLQAIVSVPWGQNYPQLKNIDLHHDKELELWLSQTANKPVNEHKEHDFRPSRCKVTHLTCPPLHPFSLSSSSNFSWCLLQRSPPRTQPKARKRWVKVESWNLAR